MDVLTDKSGAHEATEQTPSQMRASDLVRVEAAALEALADRLNGPMQQPMLQAEDLVIATLSRGARVLVCGVGKSGLIARKIAATLCSTGTPAHFLHPAEAFHGDLGMLTPGDIAILLSASGETDEIVALLPALKRLGAPVLAFCGCPTSTLAKAADISLDTSCSAEACPNNLAPTASTTVMLALGDALALRVSARRGFEPAHFADLHPGGRLGRRLTRVRDLMHAGDALPRVLAETPMVEVIYEMSRKKLGMTTVLDHDLTTTPERDHSDPNAETEPSSRLLGLISDGDLRRLLERDGPHALEHRAGEIMNPHPITIDESAFATAALTLMEQKKITSLIVTREGKEVLGVVHLHDLWSLHLI